MASTERYTLPVGPDHDRDLLVAGLWEAGSLGVWERDDAVVAWFRGRSDAVPPGGRWEPEPERDWAAEWKAGLEPVQVGAVTVTPSWRADEVSGPVTIVLDPGMAFGTGHHATTRHCLLALQRAAPAETRVLDVGTGSGVLAIAAAKLGARTVVAIDVDPEAVTAARENIARNGVAVDLRYGGIETTAGDEPFDVVVANLATRLILELAASLLAATAPGGMLVLGGIGRERASQVSRRLQGLGAEPLFTWTEDEWATLVLRAGLASAGADRE